MYAATKFIVYMVKNETPEAHNKCVYVYVSLSLDVLHIVVHLVVIHLDDNTAFNLSLLKL